MRKNFIRGPGVAIRFEMQPGIFDSFAGGGDAARGRNSIERADGTVEILGATAVAEMREGDVFVIETPGGGAFGAPETD